MPRFYFHLRHEGGLSRDAEGIEFSSLDEAYLEAFRAAADLWRELLLARKDPRLHAFEIADASGEVVLVLPFTEVLDAARPAKRRARPLAALAKAQASAERNAMLTEAIRSEICSVRNQLAQSRVLLDSVEAMGSKSAKTLRMGSSH
jgi:hypothetical protein